MTNLVEPTVKLTPQPAGMKHRFHAMVKPVGSLCNLNCTYCYYLHKEGLLHQPKAPRMSDELLEQHIRQYIEAQTGHEVVFSWQGGEPTLLGLEFFHKLVALEGPVQEAVPGHPERSPDQWHTARCGVGRLSETAPLRRRPEL